jgi:hypothetical protein
VQQCGADQPDAAVTAAKGRSEAFLADLKKRQDAMRPLMNGFDWRGMTRPLRDPEERTFFERMGVPLRFIETTDPEPPTRSQPGGPA